LSQTKKNPSKTHRKKEPLEKLHKNPYFNHKFNIWEIL